MKPDADHVIRDTNDAIEKRLDQIEEQLLKLSGRDLAYFVGYWDAFNKVSYLDEDEEAGYRANGDWDYYEMGFQDGEGDRKEYDERKDPYSKAEGDRC